MPPARNEDQLGDTTQHGGYQFTACALAATMHQLVDFFQGYRFIERYQLIQGRHVHAQPFPIAQMRAQNNHALS